MGLGCGRNQADRSTPSELLRETGSQARPRSEGIAGSRKRTGSTILPEPSQPQRKQTANAIDRTKASG